MSEAAPRAFYRWELPEGENPVDFHLNLIELLDRDVLWADGKVTAGVLLGRSGSRNATLTVEHYDRITPEAGAADSPFADPALIERSISRWRVAQTRMKPVGFYRTCAKGKSALTEADLAAVAANFGAAASRSSKDVRRLEAVDADDSGNSECLFLLIEPGEAQANPKAVLFVLRDGQVVSQSSPTVFSRHGLTNRRTATRAKAPEARTAVPFERPAPVQQPEPAETLAPVESYQSAEGEETGEAPVRDFSLPRKYYWIAGGLAVVVFLIAGLVQLTPKQGAGSSPLPSAAPPDPGLSLKLQKVGNDLQLSWNTSAPAISNALKGRLLISDGSLQKDVSLEASDLRGGTVIYSPITNDVVMRLEVQPDGSPDTVTESVRMVEGLPAPLPAASQLPQVGALPEDRDVVTQRIPASGQPALLPVPGDVRSSSRMLNLPPLPGSPAGNPASASAASSALRTSRSLVRPPSAPAQPKSAALYGSVPATAGGRPPQASNTRVTVSPREAAKPVSPTPPSAPRAVAGLVEPKPVERIPVIGATRAVDTPFASATVPASSIAGSASAVMTESERTNSISSSRVRRGGSIEPARLVQQRNPVYPAEAKQLHIAGTVEVHFKIGIDGQVRDVRAVSGPSVLAQAAIEAVQARQYRPSRVEGVPTETDASAVFLFKLY